LTVWFAAVPVEQLLAAPVSVPRVCVRVFQVRVQQRLREVA